VELREQMPKIDIENLPLDRSTGYPTPFSKAVEGRERNTRGRGSCPLSRYDMKVVHDEKGYRRLHRYTRKDGTPSKWKRLTNGRFGSCATIKFSFVPEFQSSRGERFLRILSYPETDACDEREAIAACAEVGDHIEEVRYRRPCGRRPLSLTV
jgi:hypothetical protein